MIRLNGGLSVRGSLAAAALVLAAYATAPLFDGTAAAAGGARPKGFVAELVGMSSDDARFAFVEEQIRRCMADAGLVYTPQKPTADEPDSRERRQRLGFGVSIPDDGAAKQGTMTSFGLLSPADREHFYSELRRCYQAGLAAAAAKVDAAAAALPADLRDEIRSVSDLSHPVVAGGIAKWSACLAAKGYHYTHPLQVMNDVQGQRRSLGASPAAEALANVQASERALAVADWDCAQQSHPGPALAKVLSDLEARAAAAGAPSSPYQN